MAVMIDGTRFDRRGEAGQRVTTRQDAQAALRRGIQWLLRRQSADGGWRSETYGQMRRGVGNTALAVYSLAGLGKSPDIDTRRAIERGHDFLTHSIDSRGFVRSPEGSTEHPVYATALTLLSVCRAGAIENPGARERMSAFLLASQQSEAQGWSSGEPEFGGWHDFLGREPREQFPNCTNVSVTSFALEALAANATLSAGARKFAIAYLARCQRLDEKGSDHGGFWFAPQPADPRNKAGAENAQGDLGQTSVPEARAYGTATADGLVALLACGRDGEELRVKAAIGWLGRHFRDDRVPGVPDGEEFDAAREGLLYYYYHALARVARLAPRAVTAEWRASLVAAIVGRQQADGSWQNACGLMQEDDPLIATLAGHWGIGRSCARGSAIGQKLGDRQRDQRRL